MRYLTAGESHGEALVVIIEGLPAGVPIKEEELIEYMKARQDTLGRSARMQLEEPKVKIISGVAKGYSIGSPISVIIPNYAQEEWYNLEPITTPRPGHADLAGGIKYNFNNLRYVWERASARDTAARLIPGAIASTLLKELNIYSLGYVLQIEKIKAKVASYDYSTLKNLIEEDPALRSPDREIRVEMRKIIEKTKEKGDTIGGIFEVVTFGLPIGLGSYVHWDLRLDARLAYTIMSIPGVKGVEFGLGFKFTDFYGSQVQDRIIYSEEAGFYRESNHAGGIEGGVTNGAPLIIRGVIKPVPTINISSLSSVDIFTKEPKEAAKLRGDTCVVPSAAVIAESLVAIDLVSAIQDKFGGDTLDDLKKNYANYRERCQRYPYACNYL